MSKSTERLVTVRAIYWIPRVLCYSEGSGHSPVSSGADVDFTRLASRFKLVGQCYVVAEQAIARHLDPDHAGQHRPRVEADTHLEHSEQPTNQNS